MALKITVIGHIYKESTNYDQLWAINNIGHNESSIDYRKIAAEARDSDSAAEEFRRQMKEISPDIAIFSKFNGWPPEAIQWTKEQGILTWYWYMDPISFLTKRLLEHAVVADFASATGIAQVEYMKAYGANAHRILEGVNYSKGKYKARKPETEWGERRLWDVAFIGSKTKGREYILNRIRGRGHEVVAAGPGWSDKYVDSQNFKYICTNSEVVLGRDREQKTYGYFSDRAFRTMYAGGLYTSVKPPGTDDVLIDGVNGVYADNDEELLDKIDEVLEDPIAYGAEEIRDKAVAFINSEYHSWDYKMQKLINIVKEDGRIPEDRFEHRKIKIGEEGRRAILDGIERFGAKLK